MKVVGRGKEIAPKYNLKGGARHASKWEDHYVVIGDKKLSRELRKPGLPFDRSVAQRLTFDPPKKIRFDKQYSDLQNISSATRNIRVLTKDDVRLLLDEIRNRNL
ncbi:MAG: hypothetical protein H3Z51_00920 [archaeon]|nr:hypothetical protein [archaeon]